MNHPLSIHVKSHKVAINKRHYLVQHIVLTIAAETWAYFLLQDESIGIVLGKEMVQQEVTWLGNGEPAAIAAVGKETEHQTGIILPANSNPFEPLFISAAAYSRFNIDSIEVEKVRVETEQLVVCYYTFCIDDSQFFKLASFQMLPAEKLNWYPMMPMDAVDVFHVSEMLLEYESGELAAYEKANNALAEMLKGRGGSDRG